MSSRPLLTALLLLAAPVRAEQALLLDVRYTHTSDNSALNRPFGAGDNLKGSHAYFAAAATQPQSYLSPVNYRAGSVHVVMDVIKKPSAIKMNWGGCLIQGNATCMGYLQFTQPGRYDFSQNVSTFYNVNAVDWSKRFGSVASIFRDPNEKKLDLGEGFLNEPDYSAYFPLELRVRIYAVAAGSTFVPPVDDVRDAGFPIRDAGTPAADAGVHEDAGTRDAGPPDSGLLSEPDPEPATPGPALDAGDPVAAPPPRARLEDVGGCSAAPGLELFALASLVFGLRRRNGRGRSRVEARGGALEKTALDSERAAGRRNQRATSGRGAGG